MAERQEFVSDPENFEALVKVFEEKGIVPDTAEQTRKPEMTVNITDAKVASQVIRMIEKLEESDDVQNVTANYLIDDSIADQIED